MSQVSHHISYTLEAVNCCRQIPWDCPFPEGKIPSASFHSQPHSPVTSRLQIPLGTSMLLSGHVQLFLRPHGIP